MSKVPAKPLIHEIATFLAATSAALRESVTRLEKTSARITETVATRPSLADRDLIVTLQDFDRLQQELATLVEVLTRAAQKSGESWLRIEGGGHPAEDAIAAVTIAELKDRLMYSLSASPLDVAVGTDEMVF
jgi:hypothetical protein